MRKRILHIMAYVLGIEIKIGDLSFGKVERRLTD